MADAGLKTINKSMGSSFTMNSDKAVTPSFSSSNLGGDAFYLYVAGGLYETYRYVYYDDDSYGNSYYDEPTESWVYIPPEPIIYERTKDQVGWPHSNPYVPGPVVQMQVFAPETRTYSINLKLNSAYSFNSYDSGPENSFYRFRLDVDGTKIYDGQWQDGWGWPYNQNLQTSLSPLKWVDFGSYDVHLTKGIHTVLLRMGACHQYNKHAAILADDVKITLS